MYNTFFRFFGLRENPFNVNPDPGYLYLNQRTRHVLEEMSGAIQARKGLVVLTGDAGTGKTTIINRLKEWLNKQHTPTAFIFNPHLEVNELFNLMLAEYGISEDPHLHGSSLARLNQWLLECHGAGNNAVLIVDEAQGLPLHVLEQVRMLLNHEMPDQKLLQVVLSGQPELEDKLKRPEMRQIRQRISLRCYTSALTHEEARAYIHRRVQIAGGADREVFSPEAIEMIHLYSRGIPRVMNLLCEHAMIRAYANQTQPVSAFSVQVVAKALQFDDVKPINGHDMPEVSFSSKSPVEFATEKRFDSPLLETDPLLELEPNETAAKETAAAPLLAESLAQKEPETPHWTWFEATLDPASNLTNEPALQAPDLEPETPPRPVLVSEFQNTHDSVQDPGGSFVTTCQERSDESPFPLPQPLKKQPIAITSAAKRNRSQQARQAFSRSQDYLAVVFARASEATLAAWERCAAFVQSQDWEKHFDALVRWLQQPLPTVKVHRRAGGD
ncbi:MAG TPA: AAA family ATPase [Candidatus Acidoferrales bacterium]|jgi:type II secretory pathway predicted ATPase ExeA|nr:AAA family ATPase [Candidatus Acidoferrales bacterium]